MRYRLPMLLHWKHCRLSGVLRRQGLLTAYSSISATIVPAQYLFKFGICSCRCQVQTHMYIC